LRRLPVPVVFAFLVLALGGAGPAAPARAADGNVGLVISSGGGQVQTYCFSVPPAGIAGLDLLQRTGLPLRVDYVSLGGQVCAINGVGCLDPNQPCACQCQGTPCVYWQYAHWRNDHWVASTVGASSYIVKPGSIEGWGWGANPPAPGGNALCALAAPATATSRPAPPPAPTYTPRPTRPPASPTPRPLPARTAAPAPGATVAALATAPLPAPTATPVPLPPTDTPVAATATAAPTDTPPPTPTAPASATDTPAPVASATPPATPALTVTSPAPAPAAEGPPATYWLFGVLVLALVGVIAWARTGRQRG
jgi:hypothetical protein